MIRTKVDNGPFAYFMLAEAALILLYGLCVRYDDTADTGVASDNNASILQYYPMYQDVHVMVFVGFGFLMTFLRKYGYGAVGLTFLLASVAIQWSILVRGFWESVFHKHFQKIALSVVTLINADFAAATVLISFGGVLGKLSPNQLLIMTLIELVVYGLNEAILVIELRITDVGGSMIIHTFGAYFGLAVAWMVGRPEHKGHKDNTSTYHSNLFAFVGTLFLWLFWPSFNAAVASSDGNGHHRAVINTVLAITTSTIVTFFVSNTLHKRRFEIVEIQNATLAGGVAIGASANLYTTPWGAMVVGLVAGLVSTLGFGRLLPLLSEKIRLYDTCGIHNLHGLPGIIGALASAIFAAIATSSTYGADLTTVFPARDTRTASEQAGYQLLGLATTLGIAITSGLGTGLLLRVLRRVEAPFTDENHWLMPEEEIPMYFAEPADVPLRIVVKDVKDGKEAWKKGPAGPAD